MVRLGLRTPTPVAVLWVAAALAWAAVSVSLGVAGLLRWGLFGAAFFVATMAHDRLRPRSRRLLLALQTVAALALHWDAPGGSAYALLIVIAPQALFVVGWRGTLGWIVIQAALAALPMAGRGLLLALQAGSVLLGLQALAIAVVHLAAREARARADLASANEDLRVAQDRLVQDARQGDRRPSPGDDLGEHLTTLSLSLETGSPLLVMMASQAAAVLSWRDAIGWLLAQAALACVPFAGSGRVVPAFVTGLLLLAFQAVAFATVHLAARETRPRVELARVREELRAAQDRLAEGTRLNERLRIARELHDVLGHHLTALSLNLEIASHLADERTAPHVGTAADLTRLLLSNVRGVVSALREDGAVDLTAALRALAEGVPLPLVHLELPEGLGANLTDPEDTRTLLRCVQEIVTNAVRHAHASNLWVTIEVGASGVTVYARDDGRGVDALRPGNGLRGMRERLEQVGGRLELESCAGEGFALTAVLPLTRGSA